MITIRQNKWINGAIPAVLIHGAIGSVYAWSLFVQPVSECIGASQRATQFAFSLAIFFLGMSAAFGGSIVERNIHKSSIISLVCFCGGLLTTALAIYIKSLFLIYIGYGCLMGVGLGVGYITPVKTLMLWFKEHKGLATGISVCAFGFASSIASPIITFLKSRFDLPIVFVIMSSIYFIPMLIAHFILKKPKGWIETQDKSDFNITKLLKDYKFRNVWIIVFINITCGLAVISVASPMLTELNISQNMIAVIVSVMGIFNGVGRLIFSAVSDKLKKRVYIYYFILGISIVIAVLSVIINKMSVLALVVISACYGAGFSCLPSLLSDIYGMKNISKIHGLSLTAWAIAGLVGNQMSVWVQSMTRSYIYVFVVTSILYLFALVCAINSKLYKGE